MNFILLALLSLGSASAQEPLSTICAWITERDGDAFATYSNLHTLQKIKDCVNAVGITVLVLEPDAGPGTYDGQFVLEDEEGHLIGSCDSATVSVMSDDERENMYAWLLVNRKDLSDVDYLSLLRTPEWQTKLTKYFKVNCQDVYF